MAYVHQGKLRKALSDGRYSCGIENDDIGL